MCIRDSNRAYTMKWRLVFLIRPYHWKLESSQDIQTSPVCQRSNWLTNAEQIERIARAIVFSSKILPFYKGELEGVITPNLEERHATNLFSRLGRVWAGSYLRRCARYCHYRLNAVPEKASKAALFWIICSCCIVTSPYCTGAPTKFICGLKT